MTTYEIITALNLAEDELRKAKQAYASEDVNTARKAIEGIMQGLSKLLPQASDPHLESWVTDVATNVDISDPLATGLSRMSTRVRTHMVMIHGRSRNATR
jgi:hypothetical protein